MGDREILFVSGIFPDNLYSWHMKQLTSACLGFIFSMSNSVTVCKSLTFIELYLVEPLTKQHYQPSYPERIGLLYFFLS